MGHHFHTFTFSFSHSSFLSFFLPTVPVYQVGVSHAVMTGDMLMDAGLPGECSSLCE